LGGVRFNFPTSSRVSPFAQLLGGVLRSSETIEYQTASPSGPFGDSAQPAILDLGAGLNAMITRRFGIRAGGGLRLDLTGAALGGDDTTMARVFAGVVFAIP
jgi:hypothetical protein